ncbi:MAG: hypothetical protein K0B15_10890 [Lentimicrobium sp.]|nr:hypothetical protein [Lentimicrobium sp.]
MKTLRLISWLLVVAMFMVSCEKGSKETKTADDENTGTLRTSLVSAANPLNEYDYVGQAHNAQLIKLIDSVTPILPIDSTDIYNYFYVLGLPSFSDFSIMRAQRTVEPKDYVDLMSSIYKENSLLFPYIDVINSIVISSSLLQEKTNALISYENTINYSNLTKKQAMALKAAISVARYSSVLWASKEGGGLGYYENNYKSGSKDINPIVAEDIWGTLGAALFTGNPFTAKAGGLVSSGIYWLGNTN